MPSTHEYCAIGETTTRFVSVTPRSVNGVNIGGTALRRRRAHACALGDPVLVRLDVVLVAQAQVLVADALAARQQRVGELLGRRGARSASTFSNHSVELRAAFWIFSTSTLRTRLVVAAAPARRSPACSPMQRGELDRVLQRELGARADREVRGVRGVADQHDRRAAPLSVHPVLADDAREVDPLRRAAQVRGVRHQRVAVEVLGEQLLAEGDRLLLAPSGRGRRLRQTSSGVSTMKVEVSSSNW